MLKLPEVEERVAHAGVLPVDDPDPLAVVDEVGVEQVVVAGPQLDRRGQAGARSMRRPIARAPARTPAGSARRERRPARGTPRRCAAARTGPGWPDRRGCGAASRPRARASRARGPASRLTGDAVDEAGDEVALRPDEGGHLRPDPDPRRRHRRGVLHLAADAEQVGVVAGQPDDVAVRAAGDVDQEVAVGDPAESGVSVSSRPASSGTRCSAPTSSSRSSPRSSSSGRQVGLARRRRERPRSRRPLGDGRGVSR